MSDYTRYLNELLKEEMESVQADAQALRNSLRYRIGGIVLEAFPLSLRSFAALWRLMQLYRQRSRPLGQASRGGAVQASLPVEALSATHLMLANSTIASPSDGWTTGDPQLLAQRIDRDTYTASLTLRLAASSVVRRLARLRAQGCKIIWWPEDGVAHDPALVAYIQAHADECRKGESS